VTPPRMPPSDDGKAYLTWLLRFLLMAATESRGASQYVAEF
jgi:hypothetical protein